MKYTTQRGDIYTCIGANSVLVSSSTVTSPIFVGTPSSLYISTYTLYAPQVQLVIPPGSQFTTFTAPLPSDPNAQSSSSASLSGSAASGSTPSSSAVPEPIDQGKKKFPAGAIAGIVIGFLALIALIVGCLFIRRRKQKRGITSQHHNNIDTGLPEFVPYGDHATETKAPPVSTSVAGTPTLVSSSPHTTNRDTMFTDRSHMSMAQYSPQQPEFIPSRQPHVPPAYMHDVNASSGAVGSSPTSNVARLEADKAALEERIARMRYLSQMEEEQANMQAELERMRAKHA